MPAEKRAFYEYHASLMEPWDGPAAVAFTDGRVIGATLDRNGLRPARYMVTKDDLLIMASETGVLPVKPEDVVYKGRLQPGRMLLCDTAAETHRPRRRNQEDTLAARQPYGKWIEAAADPPRQAANPRASCRTDHETVLQRQRCFGYTEEDIKHVLLPMAAKGEEPIGSMGTDTPLACLSDKPQPLFHYFKQLFAQVTNPPIDPIREELVMSLTSYIGTERNILEETPQHCHTLKLDHPILTNRDLEKLRRVSMGDFLATTLPMLYRVDGGEKELRARAGRPVPPRVARDQERLHGADPLRPRHRRGVGADPVAARAQRGPQPPGAGRNAHAGLPDHRIGRAARGDALLPADRLRRQRGQSVPGDRDAGEPGARGSCCPMASPSTSALKNYKKAVNKGLLKVFSKMGISTLQSYRGAQVFEAIGLVAQRWWTSTSPARRRASKASAWTCWPKRPGVSTRLRSAR